MSQIHELSDVLADQIAAGEVIERPASIVKELVENALDAHSRQIDIIVTEAGLGQIRIIDDGDGIDQADVAIAFKRHATSKIQSPKDLFRIKTLGFRGEALPSIASVADVIMTTATGSEQGTEIHIRGGETITMKPATARPGTDITVTDLFFNTPARLKYLKSPQTELAQITDIVDRLALAHAEVAFSLTHNERELLRTVGNGNLQQVIAAIYGNTNAQKMIPIETQDPDFSVRGFTSLPEVTRSSRQYISIIINQRYIRNFQLTKAIIQGYGSKLMIGRFPMSVLLIELDPVLIDVNVHPAKKEVRISKESQLEGLITMAIQQQMAKQNLIPDVLEDFHQAPAIDFSALQKNLNEASITYPVNDEAPSEHVNSDEQAPVSASVGDEAVTEVTPIVIRHRAELNGPAMQAFTARYPQEVVASPAQVNEASAGTNTELELEPTSTSEKERFPQLQYLGQMHGTFLLAQASDGLYIVDQHAAQERINYEYYRQKIGEVSDDQQNLLIPLVLDYSTVDVLTISDHLDTLKQVGLYLESFGQNSFVVHSHPTWIKQGHEEATIREMIDWIIKDGRLTVAQFREKTAIMMSCKRAIKANHHLDDQQAKALLKRLPECENPFNCPHGRPVLIHFDNTELEKMFKRIQDSRDPYAAEFDEHEF